MASLLMPSFNHPNNRKYFYFTLLLVFIVHFVVFLKIPCLPLGCFMTYVMISNIIALYRLSSVEPGCIPSTKESCINMESCHFQNGIEVNPDIFNNIRKVIFFSSDYSNSSSINSNSSSINSSKNSSINDSVVEKYAYIQKYCNTCNIFRPIGTSHCNDCNQCILEKDHHCIWLDTCIGRNNHRFFIYFIYTLMVIFSYDIWVLFRLLQIDHLNIIQWSILIVLSVVFLIFVIVFGCFVGYHTFLLILNLKSREFLNGRAVLKLDVMEMLRRMSVIRPLILNYNSDSPI